jgi:hypothetical protein
MKKPLIDVFAEVKRDIDARNAKGWETHGIPLDIHDGRDWIAEAYDEVLDLAVYLKAELLRRRGII